MRLGAPINGLADALGAACYRDLPDVEYQNRDWVAWQKLTKEQQTDAIKNRTEPTTTERRRPHQDEVSVYMFPQGWGSTALGYGGIGGAAMTDAYTIIVEFLGVYCVYFGYGRLAYRFDYNKASGQGRDKFLNDMRDHNMASARDIGRYA